MTELASVPTKKTELERVVDAIILALTRVLGDDLPELTENSRLFDEVGLEEGPEVKPQELELAKQIIGQIATDEFQPKKYEDDVKKRIQA